MAEADTLGQPGRSTRVIGCGKRILVEVGEAVVGRGVKQQILILAGEGEPADPGLLPVQHQDEPRDLGQLILDGFEHRDEIVVDEKHRRTCVIDRVGDLFGRQADVHRLQDGPHHRHRETGLEETVAVPVEYPDGVAHADTEPGEARRQPSDAVA